MQQSLFDSVIDNRLLERRRLVSRGASALRARNYEESLGHLRKLGTLEVELTRRERVLLGASFEAVFRERNHVLASQARASVPADNFIGAGKLTIRLQQECLAVCYDAVECMEDLLCFTLTDKGRAWCYRMKGDYQLRQLAFVPAGRRQSLVLLAQTAYARASALDDEPIRKVEVAGRCDAQVVTNKDNGAPNPAPISCPCKESRRQ